MTQELSRRSRRRQRGAAPSQPGRSLALASPRAFVSRQFEACYASARAIPVAEDSAAGVKTRVERSTDRRVGAAQPRLTLEPVASAGRPMCGPLS